MDAIVERSLVKVVVFQNRIGTAANERASD